MGFKSVAPSKEFSSTSLSDLAKNVTDLAQWAYYEFNAVQAAFNSTDAETIWNKVPPKPRRGTIAYADGTNWNPGFGEGPYYFDGTTWHPTNSTGTVKAVRVQKFTTAGAFTYTPDPHMVACIIECYGGGGAGGGVASSATYVLCSAGGGAGAYSRTYATAATIGVSQSGTVGAGGTAGAAGNVPGNAGGDTSLGSLCLAKGGGGGGGLAVANGALGGAGGLASGGTGDIRGNGANGQGCFYWQLTTAAGALTYAAGKGGDTPLGAGGQPGSTNASGSIINGSAALGIGAGGGGGNSSQIASGNASGGPGAPGGCFVTEFCSA